MTRDEVIERLQKPWGLQQALRGQWPDYRSEKEQSDAEARLLAALRLMLMAENLQNSPKELADLLLQIINLKQGFKLEIKKQGPHIVCKKKKEIR